MHRLSRLAITSVKFWKVDKSRERTVLLSSFHLKVSPENDSSTVLFRGVSENITGILRRRSLRVLLLGAGVCAHVRAAYHDKSPEP